MSGILKTFGETKQLAKESAATDWYESVRDCFLSLGFRQSFANPLLYMNVELFMSRVDDCIFVGDESDSMWLEAKASVPERLWRGEIYRARGVGLRLNNARHFTTGHLRVLYLKDQSRGKKKPPTERRAPFVGSWELSRGGAVKLLFVLLPILRI